MSTDNNYYKDLWNDPNTEAGQFFKRTNFNSKDYKKQEQVFRQFLQTLKRLMDDGSDVQPPIETVLEVGVGTGRITRIVWQELSPNIKRYYGTDIQIPDKLEERFDNRYGNKDMKFQLGWFDITQDEFYIQQRDLKYDMIISSEVFMHIKPEDISPVISKLTNKLLAPDHGTIINIDWSFKPEPSKWCYIHDYDKLYRDNGLQPIFTSNIESINQKLFCYGR